MDKTKYVSYRHELVKDTGIIYDKTKISGPDGIESYARKMFDTNRIGVQEQFYVIYLDNGNNILGHVLMSVGGITATVVDVRLIFKGAIDLLATSIITVHNHPSGNMAPSGADEGLKKKLEKAGTVLDIKLLDSLILTEDSYVSY